LEYRETVKQHIEEAVEKKEQDKDNEDYWAWVIGELLSDLRDFETSGKERWSREPMDKAFQKYKRIVRRPSQDILDMMRRFMDDDFWRT